MANSRRSRFPAAVRRAPASAATDDDSVHGRDGRVIGDKR